MDLLIIFDPVTRVFTFGDPVTGVTYKVMATGVDLAATEAAQRAAILDLTNAMGLTANDVLIWITNNLPTLGNAAYAQGIYNRLFTQPDAIMYDTTEIFTVQTAGNVLEDELLEAGEAIAEALLEL
jgi:hypothetical protein